MLSSPTASRTPSPWSSCRGAVAAVAIVVIGLSMGLTACGSGSKAGRALVIAAADRRITLSGTIDDAAGSARLQAAADVLAGGSVDNKLEVAPAAAKAPAVPNPTRLMQAMVGVFMPWSITVNASGSVAFTGSVPDEATRTTAIDGVKAAFPGAQVSAEVDIAQLPATTQPTTTVAPTTILAEAVIHPIQFFYTATSVTLTGDVADEDTRSALLTQARAEYDTSAVQDKLTVNPASPARGLNLQALFHGFPLADSWVFTFGGKGVVIQGNISEIGVRNEIVQTLNTVMKGVPVDDQLAVFAVRLDVSSTTAVRSPSSSGPTTSIPSPVSVA